MLGAEGAGVRPPRRGFSAGESMPAILARTDPCTRPRRGPCSVIGSLGSFVVMPFPCLVLCSEILQVDYFSATRSTWCQYQSRILEVIVRLGGHFGTKILPVTSSFGSRPTVTRVRCVVCLPARNSFDLWNPLCKDYYYPQGLHRFVSSLFLCCAVRY